MVIVDSSPLIHTRNKGIHSVGGSKHPSVYTTIKESRLIHLQRFTVLRVPGILLIYWPLFPLVAAVSPRCHACHCHEVPAVLRVHPVHYNRAWKPLPGAHLRVLDVHWGPVPVRRERAAARDPGSGSRRRPPPPHTRCPS